jgi:U3 small nucleolar RNA-associated protein 19
MAPSSLPQKRKAAPASSKADTRDATVKTAALEQQLSEAIQGGGSLNALADLVALARAPAAPAPATSKAIYALYRAHVTLLASGKLVPGGDEAARTARAWIWDRLNAYTDILCGLLQDGDKALRVCTLTFLYHVILTMNADIGSPNPALPSQAPLVCPVCPDA